MLLVSKVWNYLKGMVVIALLKDPQPVRGYCNSICGEKRQKCTIGIV